MVEQKNSEQAITKAADGFSNLVTDPEIIVQFDRNLATALDLVAVATAAGPLRPFSGNTPQAHPDLSATRLTFKPAAFKHGTLLAVAPSGTTINGAWTGIDRYFRLPGNGTVRIAEIDMTATGGSLRMHRHAINTRIHGVDAISRIYVGDAGRTVEEIVWVRQGKLFTLTFAPGRAKSGARHRAGQRSAVELAKGMQ